MWHVSAAARPPAAGLFLAPALKPSFGALGLLMLIHSFTRQRRIWIVSLSLTTQVCVRTRLHACTPLLVGLWLSVIMSRFVCARRPAGRRARWPEGALLPARPLAGPHSLLPSINQRSLNCSRGGTPSCNNEVTRAGREARGARTPERALALANQASAAKERGAQGMPPGAPRSRLAAVLITAS